MTQQEKRVYLIKALIKEQPMYFNMQIPSGDKEQKILLRSLFNIRMPNTVSNDFLKIQNEYLKNEISEKGIVSFSDLKPVQNDLYLWQGDITTLECDAVVNAANSQMLGCFHPCHECIDNAIHTFSGVQLRLECAEIMKKQGHPEKTGRAILTQAYNLPSKYIIHTVGPIVKARPTRRDCDLLAACYRSCLELAEKNSIKSIAFCCISTGEFHFPNDAAAEIAIKTVKEFKQHTNSKIKVIFNVFKNIDFKIYRELLK